MNKEELKKLYKAYEKSKQAYHDYVDPFFTTMWEGRIVKKASKVLNREGFKKIRELREAREKAFKDWKETEAVFYSK